MNGGFRAIPRVDDQTMTLTGTEHLPETAGKQGESETGGTESGTLSPDLQSLITAWPLLSLPIRKAILALSGVETTG